MLNSETMRRYMSDAYSQRIRPQIGPLTFLKIFVLEMIYSGKSQYSEHSYIIGLDHFHVTLRSIFLIIRE